MMFCEIPSANEVLRDGGSNPAEKAKDYQLAVDEYQKALEYAPNCPDIYYNLGICYEQLCKLNTNNCDKAINAYRKYLELNPKAEDREEVTGKTYSIEVQKEMYAKQINEELQKEKLKYVGTWKGYSYFESLGKYKSFGNIEIYMSNGNLYTETTTNGVTYSDNKGYTIHSKTIKGEKLIVPISFRNDGSIYYSYETKETMNGGIYGPNLKTIIVWQQSYTLRLVSPMRMEGTSYGKSTWTYYGHPDVPDGRIDELGGGEGNVYFEKQ